MYLYIGGGDDTTLKKYCQMLNNVIFLCVPSLFPVSSVLCPFSLYLKLN